MINARAKEKLALLLILDVLAMTLAFIVALEYGHRASFSMQVFSVYLWGFLTLLIITLSVFFVFDIHTLQKIPERFLQQIVMIGFSLFVSSIVTTFIIFFFRNKVPRAVFILFYFFTFIFLVLVRYIINKLTLSSFYWKIIVVGDMERSSTVVQLIKSRAYLRSEVAGYISDKRHVSKQEGPPYLGDFNNLVSVVQKSEINEVVVATASINDELIRLLLECMKLKVRVTDFRKVIEDITGKVPIDYLTDNWFILWMSAVNKRYFWYAKRIFDVLFSGLGLCVIAPVIALVAAGIKLDSRGSVFYSQMRVGRGGKLFRLWKIRTMVEDADKNNVHWTIVNDKRITRMGRFLRKIRIDEVPQLFNILKGDMSLIGPRPEAVSLVEMYEKEIPYYLERHMVTPGITGWAQINYRYGNSIEDTRQKLMYDFYYIKNRTIALDILIFLRTIRTVLTGKGAI